MSLRLTERDASERTALKSVEVVKIYIGAGRNFILFAGFSWAAFASPAHAQEGGWPAHAIPAGKNMADASCHSLFDHFKEFPLKPGLAQRGRLALELEKDWQSDAPITLFKTNVPEVVELAQTKYIFRHARLPGPPAPLVLSGVDRLGRNIYSLTARIGLNLDIWIEAFKETIGFRQAPEFADEIVFLESLLNQGFRLLTAPSLLKLLDDPLAPAVFDRGLRGDLDPGVLYQVQKGVPYGYGVVFFDFNIRQSDAGEYFLDWDKFSFSERIDPIKKTQVFIARDTGQGIAFIQSILPELGRPQIRINENSGRYTSWAPLQLGKDEKVTTANKAKVTAMVLKITPKLTR